MTHAGIREGEGRSVDGALGGAVTVVQPRDGYRFSLDAVLLARFAAESPGANALDIGCGCGVVGLCLLALGGTEALIGLDIQPDMVDCARASAERSRLADQAQFRVGDYRDRDVSEGPFDLVVSNPPYRPPASGRMSPKPGVAVARHELCGTVKDLALAAAKAMGPGGSFCAVYPMSRLPALLEACAAAGLQSSALRCVHTRRGHPARLALVRSTKGGNGGMEVRPPLVLHGDGPDKYLPEAARLLGPP